MTRSTMQMFVLISVMAIMPLFGATGTPLLGQPTGPTFDKTFAPSTIGPGSSSILGFTIVNASPDPVTDLAFTDTLPAGVTLATPANIVSTCGGVVTAPDGGGTVSLSNGVVAGASFCAITVSTTSSVPGVHTNVSGDLTSSAGSSGNTTADLTVATDRPGFSKSFAPTSIGFGARSTLTFTIDNTANPATAFFLAFADLLPPGLVVADPSLASTTCTGGAVTAVPGSGNIALGPQPSGFASLAAGAVCEVSVDVKGVGVGTLVNVSGELASSAGGPTLSSGVATAEIEVTASTVYAVKSFTDDPVLPGDTVTLEFTVANSDRSASALSISFTDNLDATLSGLVATGLPMNNVCGAGSQLTGTSLLTLTGGSLPPEGSCTFSVTLQVPAGATTGIYPNTTSSVTADLGGSPFTGDPASDSLVVNNAPLLTKTFLVDPVGAGGNTTMEFSITNTSATSVATDIAFQDNISAFLSGTTITALPPVGFCGVGSSITSTPIGGQTHLVMSGGVLAPSGSCTFSVDLLLPVGGAPGSYINSTSPVTATVDGVIQLGDPASDTLTVVTAPRLSKEFTDDPVAPGGTVTLEFTVLHDPLSVADATAIAFSDDLNTVISGLTATGLPMNDVCGSGSMISGTTNLAFTGGTLTPGSSCTFSVILQVPAAALPGVFTNTTSDLVATVSGVAASSNPAQDNLQVTGLSITKSFTDDPVIPGDTVTLEFTIDNTSAASDATDMVFTDNLNGTLSGLAATGLPMNDICGAGSQITGTNLLVFTGGNLTAGTSCTFSVTLDVPAGAASGTYGNVTSAMSATIDGGTATIPPASDQLVVNSNLLALSKTFTDDPVSPGDTVTLEFTIGNLDPVQPATDIAFTDDLDAALSGLAAIGLPATNVCGAGSQIDGASTLSFTGGNLPAGGSCTFSVTLQVPIGVSLGTVATNTTSQATGTIGGLAVTGDPAIDDLFIDFLDFTKSFDAPVGAGGTAVLTFVIDNLDATNGVGGISFSDDLDAVTPGLAALGLPMNDVCGAGSQISGTSFLTLTNASLQPGGSCAINVDVQVPPGTAAGTYPNVTSEVFSSGLPVGTPATANLLVEPPPTFAKAFAPALIQTGGISTLTFTIDNAASAIVATALDFTDNLPAGIVVATPPSASSSCGGGTLTAVAGSGVISYTDGTLAGGASCTVSVDVTGVTAGTWNNTTGDLTSSAGNSGAATATIDVVEGDFVLTKTFLSGPVLRGGLVDIEFTLSNVSPASSLTQIAFTDDLDAVVPGLAAIGLPISDVCGAGSLLSGASVVSLTGGSLAPMASCTFNATVVIPADAPLGIFTNTTSLVIADAGGISVSASAASADVEIGYFTFDKAFLNSAVPGSTVELEFSITNPDPVNPATGIGFTDDLDAVLPGLTAVGLPTSDVCGTGSLLDGTTSVTLSGGSLAPGASCVFSATLQIPSSTMPGSYTNTTSVLTATVAGTQVAGDAGSEASDDLQINATPDAIPMLGTQGLLILAALMSLIGVGVLRTRR